MQYPSGHRSENLRRASSNHENVSATLLSANGHQQQYIKL